MLRSYSLALTQTHRPVLLSTMRLLMALVLFVVIGGTLIELVSDSERLSDRLIALLNRNGESFWLPAALAALFCGAYRWQFGELQPSLRKGPTFTQGMILTASYCAMVICHLAQMEVFDALEAPNGYQLVAHLVSAAACFVVPLVSAVILALDSPGRE